MQKIERRLSLALAFIFILIVMVVLGIILAGTSEAPENVVERSESVPEIAQQNVPVEPEEIEEVDPNVELNLLLTEWVADEPGEFGVVVQELGGLERRGESDSTVQFVSASTYKLYVSYILLQEIERGNLTYQSLTSLNRTLDDCFDSLLTYSWDVCAWPMGNLVGWDDLQARLVADGFVNTNINNYNSAGGFTGDKFTTAEDEALLMTRLYNGELLAAEETDYFLNLLLNQQWRERIPAGVPEGIEVADKPGWLYAYENDAAIVYGEDVDYVMVVLSNNSSEARIADLSSKVYAYFHPENSGQTE